MKKFKCKNQYVSVMLLVLVLSAAWAACSGSRETAEPGESDSDKALAYMMKHIGQGVTYQLDLSHPLQHRYVTDTLNDAGFDEKNSPQSFAQLAATGNKKKGSKPDDPKPAQRMPGLELAPINYISNLSVKGGEFSLTGLSTMPRGAPQTIRTHVLITLLDQKGRVLTRESSDRFHANRSGTYVSFNIRGKIPGNNIPGNKSTKENEMLTANALFLIYPQDSAQPTAAYSKITDEIIIPDDACLQEPTYKADQTDLPCTNDIDNTTPITVCWSRLSESECDYWHDGTNHPETYEFPVKGSMTFASRIDTSSSATGFGTLDITLTAVDSGGGCQLEPGSGSGSGAFPAGFTVGGDNGNVLSWELPEETFDKTDPSCQYSGTYLTNFTMAIAVNLTDGTTSGGTFTSDRNQTGDGIYYVPQIDFYEGCFAAGTKILMADGSSTEIEAFTGNGAERVKTGSGEILNAIGTTRGTE
ncbi:MAG: hypothetical protein GY950_22075, partial [bacterium]|nr:hypothetical protein [bacterium]